jgi:ubiquinol-cytochrome c reductase cytochrome b subunit
VRRLQRGVAAWIEDRTGIGYLWRRMVSGTNPTQGAWLRTTGVTCLVLILVECITGPILSVYYTPSPNAAYRTIEAIEQNPLGHFLRGLHHWASATLIILAFLTVARMFFTAEYKAVDGRRRDIVWIAAIVLTQLSLVFQLTGHVLPWDTNAVKTADVEAGIGGNVWVFGPIIKRLILGSASTGAATLSRWHGLHVGLLPLLLIALVGLPLLAHRLRGEDKVAEVRSDSAEGLATEPYYPYHLAREMVVALVVFLVVAGMAILVRTPLEKEATAANLEGYTAMSEWYVLPLHALTLIPPFNTVKFEPIVTFLLPMALFGVLFALPFIDRNPARSIRRRPAAAAFGALTVFGLVGLYGFAYLTEKEHVPAANAPGGPAVPAAAVPSAASVAAGEKLYKAQGCDACHSIGGKGGQGGPDLSHAGTQHPEHAWQVAHLKKPDSKVPGSTMPAYGQLKPAELDALADYMQSLK